MEALADYPFKIIALCKVETETVHRPTTSNIRSTYLMDSKEHVIYAKDFDPSQIVNFGREYGLILIRRSEVNLLLLIDENGEFRESYAISGEIVQAAYDHGKKVSNYPGLLVGLSRNLDVNNCTQDILASLTQDYLSKTDEYEYNYLQEIKGDGLFYERQPLQIKIITLPKRATGVEHTDIDFAIKNLIDQQILYAHSQQQDVGVQKEDGARFMVFLSINATNNAMLKELVDKYGEYIGKDVLEIYKNTASCV